MCRETGKKQEVIEFLQWLPSNWETAYLFILNLLPLLSNSDNCWRPISWYSFQVDQFYLYGVLFLNVLYKRWLVYTWLKVHRGYDDRTSVCHIAVLSVLAKLTNWIKCTHLGHACSYYWRRTPITNQSTLGLINTYFKYVWMITFKHHEQTSQS